MFSAEADHRATTDLFESELVGDEVFKSSARLPMLIPALVQRMSGDRLQTSLQCTHKLDRRRSEVHRLALLVATHH